MDAVRQQESDHDPILAANQADKDKGAPSIPQEVQNARLKGEAAILKRPTHYLTDWFWELPGGKTIKLEV